LIVPEIYFKNLITHVTPPLNQFRPHGYTLGFEQSGFRPGNGRNCHWFSKIMAQ